MSGKSQKYSKIYIGFSWWLCPLTELHVTNVDSEEKKVLSLGLVDKMNWKSKYSFSQDGPSLAIFMFNTTTGSYLLRGDTLNVDVYANDVHKELKSILVKDLSATKEQGN
jgi:hypothetical protein